jgi:AcrR family transcriptional regulator
MPQPTFPPLSGRRAQAARNDERILEAARAVFISDPDAPIAAVAKQAGVGISALYNRYAGKDELLRRLCGDGLRRFIAEAEVALADERDPWTVFAAFMRRVVDADTTALTATLAGTFTPTEELFEEAARSHERFVALGQRTREAGAIRPDVDVGDLSLLLEQLAAVRLGDERRTAALRRRALALALDALRTPVPSALPGPPPAWEELAERWEASL